MSTPPADAAIAAPAPSQPPSSPAIRAETPAPPAGLATPTPRNRLIGAACALLAIGIWGGWIVSTRHAVAGHMSPATVGFLRFVVPALVLAPAWWRVGIWPRRALIPYLLCFMGSGALFFLLVGNAMRFVPAADVGPLLPGTMPLVVALISVVVYRERLGRWRWLGFALIALGGLALGGRGLLAHADGAWRGHILLVTCAVLWAGYTLAFRRTGMSATELTGLIGLWSAVLLAPVGLPGAIAAVEAGHGLEIAQLVLVQGLGSGVIALIAFGTAIARLGSSRAAAFTGLVPALAATLAVPLLGEHPDAAAMFGIAATGCGVVLASGALQRGRTG
ncbi:DMT family transporter [Bosea sp. 117]|uniref:DMT family transporter n=1 Tax=Bosea sp. 117 TaxID=1125973 RepID=UPI0009DF0E67|nr:DMT family transporter [Bosea sp. 117]